MKVIGEFKCHQCGWVHVGLDKETVIEHINVVLAYQERIHDTSAPACIDDYLKCFRCGAPSEKFLPALPNDAPMGCTIQSVIAPDLYLLKAK